MRMCTAAMLCLWTSFLGAADQAPVDLAPVDLAKIDRTIVREPAYVGQPHYALFVFGPRAEHRAWFVIDGDSLAYLDRNGNGDLTDPEDRVELDVDATKKIKLGGSAAYKAMPVFPLGNVFGTKLHFRLWVRNLDYDISKEEYIRDWHRELDEYRWTNGSLMREAKDGTSSQNPLLLTVSPNDAQISHFDGPLTFACTWGEQQEMEPWPKKTAFSIHIGCRNLLAKNCTRQSFGLTRLTTTEVPPNLHAIATVEFPGPANAGKSTTQTLKTILDQRCCGDQFYAMLSLPKDVASDVVKVTITFPEQSKLKAIPAELTIPVNRKISRYQEQIFVMFSDPKIELKHAVSALRKRGLEVTVEATGLRVQFDNGSMLMIQLNRNSEIQKTSTAIGMNTQHAEPLSRCDARFEIGFHDLDKLLTEKTGLQEVQETLQKLTHGYIYTTWDKQLSASP